MKRISFALVAALALLANACEKHSASETADDGHGHGGHDSHAPAAHAPAAARGDAKHDEKKDEHAAPADSPKFFPEKK